ncbi:hypothetical protein E4U54_005248 [Claviceps lovelessii]|nr:hypothetical protein E4U54_005248 [Claviceps lovelessii]
MIIQDLLIPASTTDTCRLSFFLGILLHITAFRRGEWHLYTLHLIAVIVIISGSATAALTILGPDNGKSVAGVAAAARAVATVLSTCVLGIFSSTLAYRAFLHRLGPFRGPFLARLSSLYMTFLSYKNFHLFDEVHRLHAQYGDIVRVGPCELSIADPKAHHIILSKQSRCIKGPWYDTNYPSASVHTTRDPDDHDVRRKYWDKGLGSRALRDYEPRVKRYAQQLLQHVEASRGKPIDMSMWFLFYSFDVMGELALSKSFDMMRHGVLHDYVKSLHANVAVFGALRHVAWALPLYQTMPGLNRLYVKLHEWIVEQVHLRKERGTEASDVFSCIAAGYEANGMNSALDEANFHDEVHLVIFAGSDTVGVSATNILFELARNPDIAAKLRHELNDYFAARETPDAPSLSKLAYLGACIDEGMRLYPVIPSGLQRVTPPEGLQLGKVHIPGGTIVHMPTYTLHRGA